MTDLKKEVTLQTKLLLNQKRGNLSKQVRIESINAPFALND